MPRGAVRPSDNSISYFTEAVAQGSFVGSILTPASISNCECGNEFGVERPTTDTTTDTSFPTP
jgi:hypothetical protein